MAGKGLHAKSKTARINAAGMGNAHQVPTGNATVNQVGTVLTVAVATNASMAVYAKKVSANVRMVTVV